MAERIRLVWVGRTRDRALAGLVARYVERAARLAPVAERAVNGSRAADPGRRRREEMAALRGAARGAEAVLLSERGETWTTAELVDFLRDRLARGAAPVAFLAGGELGFRPEDEAWADRRLALGRLTLPHELVRVVLAEQVYRALSIIGNRKYHK